MNVPPSPDAAAEAKPRSWTLWLSVVCAFLLLATAWVVLFKVAHEAGVESVPLATKGGRP